MWPGRVRVRKRAKISKGCTAVGVFSEGRYVQTKIQRNDTCIAFL